MQFRDLKRQYAALKQELDAAMTGVAEAGTYIGGAPVKELEAELASYVGVKHCISCANGTDALTLALKVWGVGPGDAVFVPDFTFFSSAETVATEGATPVFVDVREDTFNIDPEDLEKRIEAVENEGCLRPRVMVAVDLFGRPADFGKLRDIADRHGLHILEDGAQGFGGAIASAAGCAVGNLRRACSFGDIATTSFFPAKPLGCYGDGGAIFTDDDDWAALLESIKVHGKGSFKYDNVRLGMNSRLDTLQAAILKVKFKAFKDFELDAVNRVADKYSELLAPLEAVGTLALPHIPGGCLSSWAQYTIRLQSSARRDALQALLKAAGIPSMVYYPTGMHSQTAFRYLLTPAGAVPYGPLPVTEKLCAIVLSLPCGPYMLDEEIATVVDAVNSFFG